MLEADEKEDADYNANKLFESLDPQIVKDDMINAPEMMKIFEENKLAEKMYNIVAGQVTSDQSATAVKLQQLFMVLLYVKHLVSVLKLIWIQGYKIIILVD